MGQLFSANVFPAIFKFSHICCFFLGRHGFFLFFPCPLFSNHLGQIVDFSFSLLGIIALPPLGINTLAIHVPLGSQTNWPVTHHAHWRFYERFSSCARVIPGVLYSLTVFNQWYFSIWFAVWSGYFNFGTDKMSFCILRQMFFCGICPLYHCDWMAG